MKEAVEKTLAAAKELLGVGVINPNVESQILRRAHELLGEKTNIKPEVVTPPINTASGKDLK